MSLRLLIKQNCTFFLNSWLVGDSCYVFEASLFVVSDETWCIDPPKFSLALIF